MGAAACGGSSTVSAPTAPGLTGTDSSGPTTVPATGPSSGAAAPSGFPGATTTTMAPKDAAFVAKAHAAGINAPDDVIVGAVSYVCSALAANPKPPNMQVFVVGMLGSGETDQQATADAKKFIALAQSDYCNQ